MKTVEVQTRNDIPKDYTGIAEIKLTSTIMWYKNGKLHREDGPARIWKKSREEKEWWIKGQYIWWSLWDNLDLKSSIILSKSPHPEYPTVQVWKYIDKNGIQEQIVIPGMEEHINE